MNSTSLNQIVMFQSTAQKLTPLSDQNWVYPNQFQKAPVLFKFGSTSFYGEISGSYDHIIKRPVQACFRNKPGAIG